MNYTQFDFHRSIMWYVLRDCITWIDISNHLYTRKTFIRSAKPSLYIRTCSIQDLSSCVCIVHCRVRIAVANFWLNHNINCRVTTYYNILKCRSFHIGVVQSVLTTTTTHWHTTFQIINTEHTIRWYGIIELQVCSQNQFRHNETAHCNQTRGPHVHALYMVRNYRWFVMCAFSIWKILNSFMHYTTGILRLRNTFYATFKLLCVYTRTQIHPEALAWLALHHSN